LSLDHFTEQSILKLAGRAKPLSGIFFRTVEYRFMDSANLLGGYGTQRYGGRFAPVGIRAVYFSESDAVASRELTARKKRLGGDAQITLEKYPRISFAVEIQLERCVSLVGQERSASMERLRKKTLTPGNLATSQAVGRTLLDLKIQAILFPSVISAGTNLVVFVDQCPSGWCRIVNEEGLKKKIYQMVKPN
jgi:RES domain-containing protein